MTIDVAHPARRPEEVESALLDAWETVRNSASLRLLKIIHGYGSGGRGGATRELVRNWAFRLRGRFRGIYYGEEYTLGNDATRELRLEVGQYPDTDLTMPNPGVTIIWVK
ncbi:MAG TPA: hypothetical protein VK569_07210 [Bacteroidota bacterium]|nr:hypothetical protein [Bacteroidota bacterium]